MIECVSSVDLDLVFVGEGCFNGEVVFFPIDDNVRCVFLLEEPMNLFLVNCVGLASISCDKSHWLKRASDF